MSPLPPVPPFEYVDQGAMPAPSSEVPQISFLSAGQLSLHVDTIARELFAASIAAARVPAPLWAAVSPDVQARFRRHAEVAILRMNGVVSAVALARVRLLHGTVGEKAIDAYFDELVKHTPVLGGR